ncbi:MAG: membrane protein insertion efficiency factor YidD [Desulfobacterales bacterium]|nr:membrane protein insertion efficiency factor YidD [Desulfobacterales bacterium]
MNSYLAIIFYILLMIIVQPMHRSYADTNVKKNELNSETSVTRRPFQWLIQKVYRLHIRPALGQRCDLYPSCSEYAMQALAKHGLLGLPMIADRLIREPDVLVTSKKMIMDHGRLKVVDTLSEHDFWITDSTD